MRQKGFTRIIPIAVIVLLMSAGGYVAFAKRPKPIVQQQVSNTKPVDAAEGWETYRINEYSFKYPTSQVVSVIPNSQTSAVNFVDITNSTTTRLVCPIGEAGYEAWDISSESRRLNDDGADSHSATLWTGVPKPGLGSGSQPLYVVFMYRGSPKNWGPFNEKEHSCQLTNNFNDNSPQIVIENTFRAMYESVRYRDETPTVASESTALKTYMNDQYGFFLQYPDINAGLKTFNVWTDKNEPKITYRAPFDYNLCNREGPGFNALKMTIASRKYCLETFYGVEVDTLGYDLEYISRVGNEDFGIQFSFNGNRGVVNSQIIEKVQPFFDQIISTFQFITKEQKTASDRCLQLYGAPRLEDSMLHGEKQIFCSFGSKGECTQGELNDGTCFKKKE